MDLKMTQNGNHVRIEIIGDIDEFEAEILKAKLQEVDQLKTVEIDFRHVGYIGSSGIGKLMLLHKKLALHGGTLLLNNLQSTVFRLFKELNLDTVISITTEEL